MRVRRAATLLVLLCTPGLLPSPQGQEKGHRVVTNTRLQVFFSELETQWLKAVQEKNPAALNRVVSDDFHLWTAIPRNPISREEWLLGVFGRNLQSFQLWQLAVRQVSAEIAVVSFVQTETYQSATPQTENHFIVDIWINSGSGDNWRCTDRYFSEVSGIPLRK
jgi:uncharacterized protein DUF4440